MEQSKGINLVHDSRRAGRSGPELKPSLAQWLLDLLRSGHRLRVAQSKQMHLVETLPLGGKRQLMLVSCAGEQFLVGCGPESVETIVPIKPVSSSRLAKDLDEPCQ